jgi:carbohydrate-binding DOMON domain-containing protein
MTLRDLDLVRNKSTHFFFLEIKIKLNVKMYIKKDAMWIFNHFLKNCNLMGFQLFGLGPNSQIKSFGCLLPCWWT